MSLPNTTRHCLEPFPRQRALVSPERDLRRNAAKPEARGLRKRTQATRTSLSWCKSRTGTRFGFCIADVAPVANNNRAIDTSTPQRIACAVSSRSVIVPSLDCAARRQFWFATNSIAAPTCRLSSVSPVASAFRSSTSPVPFGWTRASPVVPSCTCA